MKNTCKRLLALLLAATVVFSGMIMISADDTTEAQTVVDAINNLSKNIVTFHNCDATGNVVNINSGNNTMALAENQGVDGGNAIKFQKNSADVKEHTPAFRNADGVDTTNATAIEFDIYLSSGITFADGGWANFCVQSGYANESDSNRYIKIGIADTIKTWTAGQWNHVSIDISKEAAKANIAKQIAIRFYKIFAGSASDYFMIDNIVVSGSKTVTYADKEAIEAVAASYNALTDAQKALVTNAATLEGYQAMVQQVESNAKTVSDAIAALPATSDITLNHETDIVAARDAYTALTDEEKTLVNNLNVLIAAEEKIQQLSTPEMKAKVVVDAIAALPAVNDITLGDEATLQQVRDAYDALTQEAKDLVTNLAVLEAAETKLATLKADTSAAREMEAKIAELTKTTTVYNNCDATTDAGGMDIAANINSGGVSRTLCTDNQTEGTGSIKTQKLASRSDDPEHCIGFRGDIIDASQYTTFEFDLYVSAGMTIDISGGYDYLLLHSARVNVADQSQLAKIDIKSLIGACTAGQWNHIVVTLPALTQGSEVLQATIRFGKTMFGDNNQYLLFDNLCFVANKEITYNDKAAVETLKAQYDALSDNAKAMVSNVSLLNTCLETLNAIQEKVDAFNQGVDALPAPSDVTYNDIEPVIQLKAIYDSLDSTAQESCNYDAFALVETVANGLLNALIEDFNAAWNAVPGLSAFGLEHAATLQEAMSIYDKLPKTTQDELALADNFMVYSARLESLQRVQDVMDAIDNLPGTDAIAPSDATVINDAKAAYDALSADEQSAVTNSDVLFNALDVLDAILNRLMGDVNGDNKVDAGDALDVLKHAVDKLDLTNVQKQVADVNKDGKIDAGDALEILKKAVGKPACF